MVAEQRRFLKELKSSEEKTDRPRMTKRRLGAASRNYEGASHRRHVAPDEKMLVTQVPEPRTPDAPYKSTAR